jgi:hypothetical protein
LDFRTGFSGIFDTDNNDERVTKMGSEKGLATEYEERAAMIAKVDYIMPELNTAALRCLVRCAESILVIGRRDLSSGALAIEQAAREAGPQPQRSH